MKKSIIVIGVVLLVLIMLSLTFCTDILFNGKYNLLKESGNTVEDKPTTKEPDFKWNDIKDFEIVSEDGSQLSEVLNGSVSDEWIYALYDESQKEMTDFNIFVFEKCDKKNDSVCDGEYQLTNYNSNGRKYYGVNKNTINLKVNEENYELKIEDSKLTLMKNDSSITMDLVDKESSKTSKNDVVTMNEEIINKLNNNLVKSEVEKKNALEFAISYLDLKLTNNEPTLPEVGKVVAISKERINSLLKVAYCNHSFTINDFSKLSKVHPDSFDALDTVTGNNYKGTKEQFSNMYLLTLLPSGIDGSGGSVVFKKKTSDNIISYYRFVMSAEGSSLRRIDIKVNGNCLNY